MYFTQYSIGLNMKIGITNLLSNITTKPGSHKGGWARILKCQLHVLGYSDVTILNNKHSLDEFDCIIFDLGAEYSGSLNLFGGLDQKVFQRLNEITKFKGQFFSWKNELPDIKVLEARRNNSSTCQEFKDSEPDFINKCADSLKNTIVFEQTYKTDKLLIGDSHTASVWTPEFMIERRDGRTLSGLIEHKTIQKLVNKYESTLSSIDEILVHCSSIDIRHHVGRTENPKLTIYNLAIDLIKELNSTGIPYKIMATMGIEDESRELPKTGYFKGTPFYGTWDERNLYRTIFNETINEINSDILIHYPLEFFDDSGKLKFSVMEVPQSVHLSPEFYRTNLDTLQRRW